MYTELLNRIENIVAAGESAHHEQVLLTNIRRWVCPQLRELYETNIGRCVCPQFRELYETNIG